MKTPLVSIIVLNFNGKEHLKECLPSLLEQSYKNIEIIIVDNGSVDGSVAFVRENFPQIRLIKNAINLGFAGPCNQGAQIANGKYLFFLNNDTRLEKDCLQALVSFMEKRKEVAIVGPAVFRANKKEIESAGLFPSLSGFFFPCLVLTKNPFEVFGVTGAAMLIRKDVFKKVGGFDPDFFVYSEDLDLAARLVISGRKIYVLPEAQVSHLGGQTAQRLDKTLIVYQATKNRILLLLKNFGFPLLAVILPIHFFFLVLGIFFFLVLRKPKQAWAVMRGIGWNIKNLPLIFKKRKEVQSLRSVSDWLLLKKYFKILPLAYLLSAAYEYVKNW